MCVSVYEEEKKGERRTVGEEGKWPTRVSTALFATKRFNIGIIYRLISLVPNLRIARIGLNVGMDVNLNENE